MSNSDSKSDAESVSGDSEELEESDDDSTDTDSDPDKNIGVIVNVNAGTSEDGLAFNYAEDSTVPLSWGRSHRAEYPVMARLARKYLTVQGTSTPAERVISRLGIVLSKSRQAMSGPMFSKIMFLTDVV